MMNKGNMSRVNKRKAGKMVDMENIWKAAGIPLGAQLKVIIEDGKVIFEMDNNPKNKTGVARNILANAKGHPLFAYANGVTFCAVTIDGRTRTGQAVSERWVSLSRKSLSSKTRAAQAALLIPCS